MGDRSIIIPTSERICVFSHSVVSDSLRSHGTVACQALLSMEFSRQEYWCVCVCVLSRFSCVPRFAILRLLSLGILQARRLKNTGVGCYFLLQGIFPTLGLNLRRLHWQADSLPVSHLGNPFREKHGTWPRVTNCCFIGGFYFHCKHEGDQ